MAVGLTVIISSKCEDYEITIIKTILDGELVYRDPSGGLSILVVETLTTKVLMTNSTFVSKRTHYVKANFNYLSILASIEC